MGQAHAISGTAADSHLSSAMQSHLLAHAKSSTSSDHLSRLMGDLASLWSSEKECHLVDQPADILG